jgi:protein-S-isoprenylcysteine O-methyltransferase Ste14
VRATLIVAFPVLFIAFFVAGPGWVASRRFPAPMGLEPWLCIALGAPLSIVGFLLYLWTIVLFARAGGTQVPVAPTQSVVTTGPYAVSRNPMATSALVMIVGGALLTSSWSFLLAGLVPAPYLLYVKLFVEKELEARFGEDYLAYKRTTPFILPRPWRRRR